jgi:hypothetical protein
MDLRGPFESNTLPLNRSIVSLDAVRAFDLLFPALGMITNTFKTVVVSALTALTLLFQADPSHGAVFVGTNQPGTFQDFPIPAAVGASNVTISIAGNANAYSHLFLKSGAVGSPAEFDFVAIQNGTSNAINLELPQFAETNYVLRVSTPGASAAHAFTVAVTNGAGNIRSASRPATKPIVSVTQSAIPLGTWHYYRVDVPTNVSGWRVVLTASNTGPDLHIQRDVLPTANAALKSSTGATNDMIAFTPEEMVPGTYFIGVSQPSSGAGNYTLRTELIQIVQLSWDPGTTHLGTVVHSQQDTNGSDFYFRINVQNSSFGAWRNALTVLAGEAELYLSKSTLPNPANAPYRSERVGSDGFVLPASAFNAGEDWYVLVRSQPGSQWNLVSGDPFVTDLGTVAADASSGSGDVVMGAEGYRFFRTATANDQTAWRLWLNGATNSILVRKTAVPVPSNAELIQSGKLLVVPSYLIGGQLYFVGVNGAPGTVINLDSRVHTFTDLSFIGSTNLVVNGFPYTTVRVQVPSDQLAWQISVQAAAGNPNVAVRRNSIPNESNNDAYSEVPGLVTDSITLVPDTLSDGTFFVTVYSTNTHACTLQSGPPQIPDINYVDTVTNTDTNRVGWRIFKVADIAPQVGSLGWDLTLSNAAPGTRIALRRNRAPGIWNYRNPTAGSAGFYTILSATNFLQAPDNPADVWYVGVYNPTNALGDFTLITRELTASPVAFNGGLMMRTDVPAGKWQFFRVDVPTNALGWDVRLTDVTSGSPQLVIRRERLPVSLANLTMTLSATNWPGGSQWAAGADWTARPHSPDGSINESGRIITAGMGRPLDGGTY